MGMTRAEIDRGLASSLGQTVGLEVLSQLTGADKAVKTVVPIIDEFRFGTGYSSRTGRTELPRLRAAQVQRVRREPARRVRWTPGALPALAGRFPGAPFRTGHAPFVMHPALHDGSRREAGGRRPTGRVRRESGR
jgi:hypothetical protein